MKHAHIRQSGADRLYDAIVMLCILLLLLLILFPLWFVIIASFSNSSEVMKGNVIFWVKDFSVEAYEKVLSDPKILSGYRNTIIYTVVGTLINLAGRNFFVGFKTFFIKSINDKSSSKTKVKNILYGTMIINLLFRLPFNRYTIAFPSSKSDASVGEMASAHVIRRTG